MPGNLANENMPQKRLVASSPGVNAHAVLKHLVPRKPLSLGRKSVDQIVLFLLKVAALEAVRRLSRARCPFVWRAVQSLQLLGYVPFKWLQRWGPLRIIVKGVQKFSRPLLCLSVATALTDHSENGKRTVDRMEDCQPDSELPNETSVSDMGKCGETSEKAVCQTSEKVVSENWLVQLHEELEKQGISLPERIDDNELQRFYIAANGDLSCLLSSLKRTIRWRETYYILSSQELEMWSHLVFWHGRDVMLRPCLVIRLGLACSTLLAHDRPSFSQAIVSQIEHGVLHLINEADPRITVLMDCQGLSPFKFPMQMLRSVSTLMQDHYPNRLGTLFLIRLTPVVRVVAQTFIKVLKPATRQKLRFEGETYQKVLSEFLQTVPAFLGGKCMCSNCKMLLAGKTRVHRIEEMHDGEPSEHTPDYELSPDDYPATQLPFSSTCEYILRASILAILMMWILVAFFAGMYNPDSLASLPL